MFNFKPVNNFQKLLWECFEYRDGVLYWKERPREHFNTDRGWKYFTTRFTGIEAGTKRYDKGEYRKLIGILCTKRGKKITYFRSRLTYIWHYGEIPKKLWIDHINGDPMDDKIENLRATSKNNWNKNMYKNNTSGQTGIVINPPSYKKPWAVQRTDCNGKRRKKSFSTITEAIEHKKLIDDLNPHITERHGKSKK